MIPTTRRIALQVGGAVWDEWTTAEIVRDLAELSGSFLLELRDAARAGAAFPFATATDPFRGAPGLAGALAPGLPAAVAIDGEPVLTGYIDEVAPFASERFVQVTVSGRDKTGDMIDCAAAPLGPSEFRNLDLAAIAKRIAEPFGITVRADVDVGKPFARFVVDAGETARSAIEKAARQRAVLVTSDGIGGLVLTRGGTRRAGGGVFFPGNAIESEGLAAWRERFSDYYVLGHAEKAGARDRSAAPLSAAAPPQDAPPAFDAHAEEPGVAVTGRARDEAVGRYRPTVSLARMQTAAAPAKTTAEWMMRTARAKSEQLRCIVKGFRAGDVSGGDVTGRATASLLERGGALWRPNELVFVDDRWQGVYRDMLIAAVAYRFSAADGATTELKLVGPAAFDLLPEGDREQNHARPLDKTARPLTEPVAAFVPPGGPA